MVDNTDRHVRMIPGNGMLQHDLIFRVIEEPRLCPLKMRHLLYKAALSEDLIKEQVNSRPMKMALVKVSYR